MIPPTEHELVDPDNIEAPHVCAFFLGKNADEAYDMFKSEDFFPAGFEAFSNLSNRGLEYYLPPAIRYVESNDSAGNGEFVRGLLSSLSEHLYAEPVRRQWHSQVPQRGLPPGVVVLIHRVAEFVRQNLQKFELAESDVATVMKEIQLAPPQ